MGQQHLDALGRPIEVGCVIVHFYVSGHAMGSSVGVVREVLEGNGPMSTKLKVDFVTRRYPYWEDDHIKRAYNYTWSRRRPIKVPAYCVIAPLTEAQLLEQYNIKGETDERTTTNGPEAS